ncbi:glycosyltransferase family 2 protein [Ferrovibrio terrae]|uniref:glycosyltransferase family 2 protein n=1 Tax=Ferrovibrio terrae TaxID=2594003 RepID=UPI003137DFE2
MTVTHYSERVIGEFLAHLPPGRPLVVTDNASSDSTRDIIRSRLPNATMIANDVGRGFGNAANQGLARAASDFVLLVNPDAKLQPDCLDRLLAAAERYPEAGVLAPALRTPAGDWEVSHDVDMFRRARMSPKRIDPEPEGDICADYVSGAAMLVRRAALDAVPGFDPAIFLYYEDDDFCIRLRRAGWCLIRVADAITDHVGGGSIRRSWDKHWEKFWHMAWSRLYIERKYCGRAAMWRIALPALLRFGLKAPLYLLTDFRNKGLRDAGRFCGTLAYLMGMSSR